ncbi:hypothetical protein [Sphingobacterium faecium]|uniref:hypothetical protein n=1 Tax=Sphingobacterium faecium TaxID=34087 RepID=UPI003208AA94
MNVLTDSNLKISLGTASIYSDRSGINQLLDFHYQCLSYNNTSIEICLKNLTWFDGNLCALLGALLYRLNRTNKLSFTIKQEDVEAKFDILIHNDFLPINITSSGKKKSCIPFKGFEVKDKDGFIDYVENEVLRHHAMPKFSEAIIDKLIFDLSELYANIDRHAFTDMPFYMCGQFYPRSGIVKFTICDLGVGFLKNINIIKPEISSYAHAIKWAINGNSSKLDAPGGTGLIGLKNYCESNKGKLQIISGDHMWCSETFELKPILYPEGLMPLKYFFQGAIINLEFNKKALNL